MSLSFRGDCVLTATHIINRLPNAALNFETLFKKLCNKDVDYEDSKAFGCLALVYNSNHDGDKFSPRGVECAFIGYPSNTKVYRLLKLTTMQSMVSRHAVFYESIFPLNKNGDKSEESIVTNNELESATTTDVEDTMKSETEMESVNESPRNDMSQ
ncbi:hypothetical protein AgCh_003954 [Apium graveolens]